MNKTNTPANIEFIEINKITSKKEDYIIKKSLQTLTSRPKTIRYKTTYNFYEKV